MELSQYFRSIVDSDRCAVVICNLQHKIIYMNPKAIERYGKSGGAGLIGQSVLECHNAKSGEIIKKAADWFSEDVKNNIVYTYHGDKENKDVYMVALRDTDNKLIGYYEKHEYRNRETMKMYDLS